MSEEAKKKARKYTVYANVKAYVEFRVEAESLREALEIGEKTDLRTIVKKASDLSDHEVEVTAVMA